MWAERAEPLNVVAPGTGEIHAGWLLMRSRAIEVEDKRLGQAWPSVRANAEQVFSWGFHCKVFTVLFGGQVSVEKEFSRDAFFVHLHVSVQLCQF